jgi:hypothetical protein
MSTLLLPSKSRFLKTTFILVLFVLIVQGFAQTPVPFIQAIANSKLSVSLFWAAPRILRDELKHMPEETGMSVAMFDHGKISTARIGFFKNDWKDAEIPGAIGHSWSYEGMLSLDGTLAAFPYWEVDPCPSWKTCDTEAHRHYFLAVAHTDGSGVHKYPQIVLPSEMCWTRDNSKLAMVAHLDNDPQSQLFVLDVDSGKADRVPGGEKVAVTPQCWSPDGRQLVYFAGEKDYDRPGAIRILDTATRVSRDLLYDNSNCQKDSFCVSPYPTWSPDGEWIAYFQEKTYWAVHPSGDGRKKLFRHDHALSPLQWSPDGRYALYADCCALRDTLRCMCEIGRIRVRRLDNNADVEISGDGYQNMFIPRWTWVQRKRAR